MNLRPLENRIVVAMQAKEETTASGLVMPGTSAKERPEQGEVLAIGPGKRAYTGEVVPMNVKVGDVVLFKKYAPDEIKVEEKEYLILSETDVLAVLET